MAFHSLLWATLPFLSFITPSLQARAVLHIDGHHAANTEAATAGALIMTASQPEPIAVEGAYLVAFKDSYRYDEGFIARLSDEVGIQATLRADLTGEVFNGISIQVSHNQADGQQEDEEEDIPIRIKTLDEVVAVSPMRQHPKPPVIPSQPLPTGVFKRQRLGQNNSLSAHLMAQVDQAHAAGYTGKGQKIAIIDALISGRIDYTHPALGGCLGKGCLVSFSREWLEDDDKNNPDPACKSHATALAGVIAAQEAAAGFSGVAAGVELGSYAISGCKHGFNDEKLLQALDQGVKDGVTALVFSMGILDGWTNNALDLAFDRASRRGLLIAVATGNHGGGGIFMAARPAEATEVLGVGSVDNTNTRVLANVSTYTYTGSDGKVSEFAWRDGEPGSGATGWGDVALPLWSGLNFSNRSD
ncbi:hypothetical protein PG989_001707 [Apiospora arundinis]|uniref:Peptidase S8/S53 domain-containing protein n=1 Tax=Apiospora arundinis TaxID=335852 RepID=A0ABR2HLK4_9PEZI